MYHIDLNFYGPYRSIWTLQRELSESQETRAIYMARHPNITAIARQRGLTGDSIDEELNRAKCNVAYIGITAAADPLGSRFGKKGEPSSHHHKIGPGAFAKLKLPAYEGSALTDFWAGYFARRAVKPPDGGRHEWRLLVAEDVLISYFLPPLNRSGVRRKGVKEELGSGSFASASVNFHWWSPGDGASVPDRPRSSLPGFPKTIVYDRTKPELNNLNAYF